jgi:hypothetical protein
MDCIKFSLLIRLLIIIKEMINLITFMLITYIIIDATIDLRHGLFISLNKFLFEVIIFDIYF